VKASTYPLLAADEAATLVLSRTGVLGTEEVALADCPGRVLAADLVAAADLPPFPASAVDGFAVRSQDGGGRLRVVGESAAGRPFEGRLEAGCAARLLTGGVLPDGADSVVMVEDTNQTPSTSSGQAEIEVLASVAPGEDVLVIGEDIVAGALAVPAGRRLRAADLGGLAALGIVRVTVWAQPRIAILSTGDEVVPIGAAPGPAQVRDVNATTVTAIVAAAGGIPIPCGIVPDDAAELEASLRAAREAADAIVLSAGSSVSVRDLTAEAVSRLGPPGVLVHGIAIKPGKPTVLAICSGTPVVGLPGNPASALVVAWRIVRPLVRLLGGEAVDPDGLGDERELSAVLDVPVPSRPGREDFVPCTLARDAAGAFHATPVFGASNLIFTLIRADALIAVPLDRSGLAAGETVRVVVP